MKVSTEYERYAIQKKIPKSPLVVDPTLRDDIDKDTLEKIATVKKELSWASAKDSLALQKLQRKFLDPVRTERVEVFAFEVIKY
jgi:hypothetical protein